MSVLDQAHAAASPRVAELADGRHDIELHFSECSNHLEVRVDVAESSAPASVVIVTFEGEELRRFRWGRADAFGSAAFWARQLHAAPSWPASEHSLQHEVVFALLGGYGITAEINIAAYQHLLEGGHLDHSVLDPQALELALREPLTLSPARPPVRYRFPAQRAQRIVEALRALETIDASHTPRRLRDELTSLSGVGPKSASWIVRNLTGSDDIAIIDIHVLRAGAAAGVFDRRWALPRDYARFEISFLAWAAVADVPAAGFDLALWNAMRQLGPRKNLLPDVDTVDEWHRR